MNIAFIGLGRMGSAMARNLVRGGHRVFVYNRTHSKLEPLISDGAIAAASVAEAVRGCEIAVTMLANDDAVQEVVLAEGGVADSLSANCIHISSSTISTKLARRLA